MWDDLKRYLSDFPTVVLTGNDTAGYPASVRTTVEADDAQQELRIGLHSDVELQPGPASLLLHHHDEQIWNQRVVLVRGVLTSTPAGWMFSPRKLVPTMGYDGGMSMLRALLRCRKTARVYLHKRGLPRPHIPWEQLQAFKAHEQNN